MQVAQTILEQLGGRMFLMMTGAKSLIGAKDALTFSLPSRFAKRGINRVRVTLTPADLYRVEFFKIGRRGLDVTTVAAEEGVYAEDLRRLFTRTTGLDCTL